MTNQKFHPFSNNRGFTLVELMTVVGIIAVLTVIAGPQYDTFVVKARQSEAKTSLAFLYTAQTSYSMNEGSYTACLRETGFDSTGTRMYAIGFHNSDFWNNWCGPDGFQQCGRRNWDAPGALSDCTAANTPGDGINYFAANVSANSNPPASSSYLELMPTDVATTWFQSCASGAVNPRTPDFMLEYDTWCINNQKVLIHLIDI